METNHSNPDPVELQVISGSSIYEGMTVEAIVKAMDRRRINKAKVILSPQEEEQTLGE